jgi:hydroxyacylglutathione hydrolase
LIETRKNAQNDGFIHVLMLMQIHPIPALQTNYIFLLHDRAAGTAAIVDPGEAAPVLAALRRLDAKLVTIFNTHCHRDHVGGNQGLMDVFPDVVVYGSAVDRGRIPGQQVFLGEGDRVEFGGRSADVLAVPGHLDGHIAYYFAPIAPDSGGELFSGDVIFGAGCGRLFDGPASLAVSSIDRLRNLPDDTRIWFAHEYTLTNLKFAIAIDPTNVDLQQYAIEAKAMRDRGEPTVPTTICREKQINPFLRWDAVAIREAIDRPTPAATFAELRRRKEAF